MALFDPAKMEQAVDNLVTFAIKYSPPGSCARVHLLISDEKFYFPRNNEIVLRTAVMRSLTMT